MSNPALDRSAHVESVVQLFGTVPAGIAPIATDFGITVYLASNAELSDELLTSLTRWRREQYLLCGFYDAAVVNADGWLESEVGKQRPEDLNVLAADTSSELLAGAIFRQPVGLKANVSFTDPARPNFPFEDVHGREFDRFTQLARIDASDAWEVGRFVRDQTRKDTTMRRAALALALAVARYVTDPENEYRFRLLLGDLDPSVALGLLYALDAPVVVGEPHTVQLPKGHAFRPRYENFPTAPFLIDLRDSGYASRTRWRRIEKTLSVSDDELAETMSSFRTLVASTPPRSSRLLSPISPETHEEFYAELTTRNSPLITAKQQKTLRTSKIVIAGCGSTGGACGMPLLRSGAEHFSVYDPGTFELNNFNRQEATLDDIGRNKCVVLAERMHGVNQFAEIDIHAEGVRPDEIRTQLDGVAVIIDAIDVTTTSGMNAKLALHEAALEAQVPVITAYDIAMRQYVEVFDYRRVTETFDGRLKRTPEMTPNEMLAKLLPIKALPKEIFPVIESRATNADEAFPQLAMTANLLSAVIIPIVLNTLSNRKMPSQYCFDLLTMTRTRRQRIFAEIQRLAAMPRLWRTLNAAKQTTPDNH